MLRSSSFKLIAVYTFIKFTLNAYAGIDWSRYGDAPAFFLGWEKSLYFAIAALVLFGVSWIITDLFKDKNGSVEGGPGCFLSIVNVAMIICAFCSAYLLIPLAIIYFSIRDRKKK